MKKISSYSIFLGILLILTGFIYGIVFAGIPYQDAPEHLLIEYNKDQEISNSIMITGLFSFIIGCLIKIAGKIRKT